MQSLSPHVDSASCLGGSWNPSSAYFWGGSYCVVCAEVLHPCGSFWFFPERAGGGRGLGPALGKGGGEGGC